MLTENGLNEMCLKFFVATSNWLIYLQTCNKDQNLKLDCRAAVEILSGQRQTDEFNLYLFSLVPEFFLSNMTQHLIFLSRFKNNANDIFSNYNDDNHVPNSNSIITTISLFMGNTKYLINPHSRAALAECLETLLPNKSYNKNTEALFVTHMCAPYLSESLLSVFVSIEMTGQSVQFEQKFNYRRPMYEILEYLWSIDLHRKKIEVFIASLSKYG